MGNEGNIGLNRAEQSWICHFLLWISWETQKSLASQELFLHTLCVIYLACDADHTFTSSRPMCWHCTGNEKYGNNPLSKYFGLDERANPFFALEVLPKSFLWFLICRNICCLRCRYFHSVYIQSIVCAVSIKHHYFASVFISLSPCSSPSAGLGRVIQQTVRIRTDYSPLVKHSLQWYQWYTNM